MSEKVLTTKYLGTTIVPLDYTQGLLLSEIPQDLPVVQTKYKINSEYNEHLERVDYEHIANAGLTNTLNQMTKHVLSRLYGQCEIDLQKMKEAGVNITDFRLAYWVESENMQIKFHAVICHKDAIMAQMPDGSTHII